MKQRVTADGKVTKTYKKAELKIQPRIAEIFNEFDGVFDLETIRNLIDDTTYNEYIKRDEIEGKF